MLTNQVYWLTAQPTLKGKFDIILAFAYCITTNIVFLLIAYPSGDHVIPLSEYQLIRTRAKSLTQSGWGRTVLRCTLSSLAWSGAS